MMKEKIEYILKLKKEKNAIILAHYYQIPEIQDVADFLGDSLALAQAAKSTNADIIVFCGVHFMAETAKILNPTKKVILPDFEAGCSLADSIPENEFRKWKQQNPDATFITYINCPTEIKALSDIICTSSNAEKIVKSVPHDKQICFAPDKNLGTFISEKFGRQLKIWDGGCHVHLRFSEEDLIEKIATYPNAKVLAHPECPQNILKYADFIGSTTGIINYTKFNDAQEFIILTETGVIHQMKLNNPYKKYYAVSAINGLNCNDCEYMKKITIDKLITSLETLQPQIFMEENLRLAALKPLEKMLELSK